jgi:hydrogenase expression/formation protein HypC
MCLGVPGKVVSIDDNIATVDFWGVQREVRLDIVDEPVAAGDYVLNHVGFAIRRIPDTEVAATMALYDELLAIADQQDLLLQDVQGELRANGRVRLTSDDSMDPEDEPSRGS